MSELALPLPQSPEPPGPTTPSQRIEAIDVLRGLALFGILAANMRGFSAPEVLYFSPLTWFKGTADVAVQYAIEYLVQGKFITLFACLFGVGFAAQISRAMDQGRSIRFYPRRLSILLLLGIIHGALIWWGDILLGYALCGFVLLLFRNRRQKTIAIWGIVLFVLPLLGMIGFTIAVALGHGPSSGGGFGPPPASESAVRSAIAAYRGGVAEHVGQNVRDWMRANAPLVPIVLVFVLPRFLAGLWLWRTGLFRNMEQRVPAIRRVWMWSGMLGAAGTMAALIVQFGIGATPGQLTVSLLAVQIIGHVSIPAIAAFYGSSVLLLAVRDDWKPRLAPFGAVGRMALTNYLTHSLVLANFFWLTGLYGNVGPAFGLIPTFALYAAQVKFSMWWLERYQFGPAEWLWRWLTYGRKPAMRREAGSSEPPRAAAVAQV
jgi:uncharacterized protein